MNRPHTTSRRTSLSLAAAAVMSVALATARLDAQAAGIAVGTRAPDAAVTTLDGKPMQLRSMLGETPVVIEFFATWCPLCRALESQMKELQRRHGDAVRFITVTVPDNQSPDRVRRYVEKNQLGGTFLFDGNGAAVKSYQVPHTSYVVIVDRSGIVRYTGVGAEQDLAKALAPLLPQE